MRTFRILLAWLLAGAVALAAGSAFARTAPACESQASIAAGMEGCDSCGDKGNASPGCPIQACSLACLAGPVTPAAASSLAELMSHAVPIPAAALALPARSNGPEPPPPR